MPMNATVFVIDDDPCICEALKFLFHSVRLKCETFNSAKDYLNNHYPVRTGCLIIDVRMPGMSGLELLEELKHQRSTLPKIILTGYADALMAVRAMKAGATDFFLKPINDQIFLEVIQGYLKTSFQHFPNSLSDVKAKINNLTSREKQVMDLVLVGKLNKEIAYDLNISISTVEVHRARVMQKMEVKTLAELIKLNIQAGNF